MTATGERVWVPYCGAAPEPGEWLARWNFDPPLVVLLLLASLLCATQPMRRQQRVSLGSAIALAAILFVSPFCALTSALFSARVVHHVVLAAILAPLLALSFRPPRLGSLVLWTALQALVFWAWHAPPLYAWALSSDAAYWLMQASLLAATLAFWQAIRLAPMPTAIAALLATMVQMGLLGALITFARAPLYAPHWATTAAWGFGPLEDQQLAGLIMWAPGAALYLAAALVLLDRWFGLEEGRAPAR